MLLRTLGFISASVTLSAILSGCEVLSDPGFLQAMSGAVQNAGDFKQCLRTAGATNNGAARTACSNQYNENAAQQIAQINQQ
jgi:hypothetical protein